MSRIPDPRRYGGFAADDPLGRLVQRNARDDAEARTALLDWLSERLAAERDDEIDDALRRARSHAEYQGLWKVVCRAVDDANDEPVTARLFAFPIVLVAAAQTPVRVAGALPDIDAVRTLLEEHGAVGATRNFGVGNALCSAETLERLKPSRVRRWSRQWNGAPRELVGEDLHLAPGREQVELRFLVGAGITPRAAPSLEETASNIGAWGLPLTRALVRQLARPGLELLAIPRPPVSLLRAPHAGRCAALEAAFHVFASNALRQFRAAVGDPEVIVSAHHGELNGSEVRVSMSSALDDTLLEGYRWPLHPLDDLDRVEEVIVELMRDCRVPDVRFAGEVLPQRLGSGRLFVRRKDAFTPPVAH